MNCISNRVASAKKESDSMRGYLSIRLGFGRVDRNRTRYPIGGALKFPPRHPLIRTVRSCRHLTAENDSLISSFKGTCSSLFPSLLFPPSSASLLSREREREREIIMSDEEHHFESKADAGASKTYPQQAGTIRKNGYIVIKNRPCKVSLSLSQSIDSCF